MKQLDHCPSSPNCVSTLAHDQQHAIAPIRYQKSTAEAQAALKRLVLELPRVTLADEEEAYLHFEFTSFLLRFVDDVEFLFDEQTKTIHFRSASRIGYGDFGVNRRRMEEIRKFTEGKV